MAWFALYVLYSLLSLLLTAFDSFYGTTLLVFPRSVERVRVHSIVHTILSEIALGHIEYIGVVCTCQGWHLRLFQGVQ